MVEWYAWLCSTCYVWCYENRCAYVLVIPIQWRLFICGCLPVNIDLLIVDMSKTSDTSSGSRVIDGSMVLNVFDLSHT